MPLSMIHLLGLVRHPSLQLTTLHPIFRVPNTRVLALSLLAHSLSVNTANNQSSCGEVSLIPHFFLRNFENSSFLLLFAPLFLPFRPLPRADW